MVFILRYPVWFSKSLQCKWIDWAKFVHLISLIDHGLRFYCKVRVLQFVWLIISSYIRLIAWFACWNLYIGRLIFGWLVGWLVDWWLDWLIDWFRSWFSPCLFKFTKQNGYITLHHHSFRPLRFILTWLCSIICRSIFTCHTASSSLLP